MRKEDVLFNIGIEFQANTGRSTQNISTAGGVTNWIELLSSSTYAINAYNASGFYGTALSINSNLTTSLSALNATNSTGFGTNWQFNNSIIGGTNNIQGDIAYSQLSVSTLANGVNADVGVSTNVFVIVSGPSAAFSIAGITGGRTGRQIYIENNTGQTLTINNNSGLDSVPANRILTGQGSDITITANPSVTGLIYDGTQSLWIVQNYSTSNSLANNASFANVTLTGTVKDFSTIGFNTNNPFASGSLASGSVLKWTNLAANGAGMKVEGYITMTTTLSASSATGVQLLTAYNSGAVYTNWSTSIGTATGVINPLTITVPIQTVDTNGVLTITNSGATTLTVIASGLHSK